MTGLQPIVFEGGCIKLSTDHGKTKYSLKVWLNTFNYQSLESGDWTGTKEQIEELKAKVKNVILNLRSEQNQSETKCSKCSKNMIKIGNDLFCLKCRVHIDGDLQKNPTVNQVSMN